MKAQVYLIGFIFLLFVSCNNEKKYLSAPQVKSIQQTFYFAYKTDSKEIRKVKPEEHITSSVENEHKDYYIRYDSLGRVVEELQYDTYCKLVEKGLTEYGENGQASSFTRIDELGRSRKFLYEYDNKDQLIKRTEYSEDRLVDTRVYNPDKKKEKTSQHNNRKYDKNGNILEEREYTVGGFISSIKEYIYKNGLLIQTNAQECYYPMTEKFMPKWGKKYKSSDYEYTNTNTLLSKTEYAQRNNETFCSSIYKYNNEGNIVEYIRFEDGVEKMGECYDNSGVLTKRIWYEDNRVYDYVYDDRGNLIEVYITSDGSKSLHELNVYKYNEYGEWIEKEKYSVFKNQKELEHIIYRSILYY